MGRTACTELQCLYKGALYLYLLYLAFQLILSDTGNLLGEKGGLNMADARSQYQFEP